MSARNPVIGWMGAALTSAALLGGAAAMALTTQRPPAPLMLDLGQMPPASAAIAALSESAPQVVDEAPVLDQPPAPLAKVAPLAPTPPASTPPAPVAGSPVSVPPVVLPPPDVVARSDMALPAQDKPAPRKEMAPKPKPALEKRVKSQTLKERPKAPSDKPKEKATKAAAPSASAAPSAPQKGQTAKGGAPKPSAAAYAKAVMKKVRATKKKGGAGRGVVVVGFTVAGDGGLSGVKVIQSSGNAALDALAVSHIRRSVPFPAPPPGAGRSFSFEFVGK